MKSYLFAYRSEEPQSFGVSASALLCDTCYSLWGGSTTCLLPPFPVVWVDGCSSKAHSHQTCIARALRHASLRILVGCSCFGEHFPKPGTQLVTCCKKREVCFQLSWGLGKSNCVWTGWSSKQLCPALPPCSDSTQKWSHRELQALSGGLHYGSVLSLLGLGVKWTNVQLTSSAFAIKPQKGSKLALARQVKHI